MNRFKLLEFVLILLSLLAVIRGEESFTNIGCFNDDVTRSYLKGDFIESEENSLQFCGSFCKEKYFVYFALTNSHECLCGNIAPSLIKSLQEEECSAPCRGDHREKCGVENRFSVFKITSNEEIKSGKIKASQKLKRSPLRSKCRKTPQKPPGQIDKEQLRDNGRNNRKCGKKLDNIKNAPKPPTQSKCRKSLKTYKRMKREIRLRRALRKQPPRRNSKRPLKLTRRKRPPKKTISDLDIEYFGCYQHTVVFNQAKKISKKPKLTSTPKACMKYCYSYGFGTIGFNKKKCLCAHFKPSIKHKVEDSVCNHPKRTSNIVKVYEIIHPLSVKVISKPTALRCPTGYKLVGHECFKFINDKLTHNEAMNYCFKHKGYIAVPYNYAGFSSLKLHPGLYHIAYTDKEKENVWQFAMSGFYDNHFYWRRRVWLKGQPDGDTRENCMAISNKGLVVDVKCDKKYAFICETFPLYLQL